MTLLAETVKNSVITILGTAAAGRFQVIGYQRQTKSAETLTNNNRLVQVWLDSNNFPRGSSSPTGPKTNDVTLKIQFTVSQPAQADLATLNNSASTDPQIVTALVNLKESAERADTIMDELWGIVYEILTDARNYYLGQAKGVVSNTWFNSLQKDEPPSTGGYVILTGTATLSFRVVEPVSGDAGNTPAKVTVKNTLDLTSDINGVTDPDQETGVLVENP